MNVDLYKKEKGIMNFNDTTNKIGALVESIKGHFAGDTKMAIFIRNLKNRMGIGSPERNATDTYERNIPIVPGSISATENEIPVKQYNIAVLRNMFKFERAEGRMQVTNKRIIFRAAGRSIGGRTTLQHEFAINEIAGIESNYNYRFSILYLVFAMLIIAATSIIIYQPPMTGIVSPKKIQSDRMASIMTPKHMQNAFSNSVTAYTQSGQAETTVATAAETVKQAYTREEAAGINVRNGIQRTRRVQTGTNWWGEPEYRTETYRDRSAAGLLEAQNILDAAIDARESAEAEEQRVIAELETAKANYESALKKLGNTIAVWRVLMTLLGLVLGIGGLIPFFVIYKRFGLKLFILNFSVFGFALAYSAFRFRIFNWFQIISIIITLICIFFSCFRPNLVISIKNKLGSGKGPITIRCNDNLNKLLEEFAFGLLVLPIIIILGMNTMSAFSESFIGSMVQIVLPAILVLMVSVAVMRLLQSMKNDISLDSGFAEVFPTEETERAIREIGAMIGDIQKLGDLGLDKWLDGGNKDSTCVE